jgi:hypothetical protein
MSIDNEEESVTVAQLLVDAERRSPRRTLYQGSLPLVLSIFALAVAFYGATIGPRFTRLHSERIKSVGQVLFASAEYGWRLGTFVDRPDRPPFSNGELHDPNGEVDNIVVLSNRLDADLQSLKIIMPDDWGEEIDLCRAKLANAQSAFLLKTSFEAYDATMQALKKRLHVFLARWRPIRENVLQDRWHQCLVCRARSGGRGVRVSDDADVTEPLSRDGRLPLRGCAIFT